MIQQGLEVLRDFADYAGEHASEDYLSLYLLVDPAYLENQSETPAWKVYLKNAIADIESRLDPAQLRQWKKVRLNDTAPETSWARTRKRLEKYLTSYRPEGKTLVLFIGPDAEYRFELPVQLPNAHYFGRPHVQEYLWALDEYQQHVVLLFAEDQTRALTGYLGRATGELLVTSDQAWLRELRKGGSHQQVQWRQDEIGRRFIRSIAGRADKFFLKNPDVVRIVLGGNVEMAHAVLSMLHPATRERVIAVLPIPITTSPHEIVQRIRDAAIQAERDHELAVVSEILAEAGAGGRGATGFTAVGRALDRAAVQLLVLPYPGAAETVEPLLLQAVRQGAMIEFVAGESAERVQEAGGVIARLYYVMN
jgi:hypothetical protein